MTGGPKFPFPYDRQRVNVKDNQECKGLTYPLCRRVLIILSSPKRNG